MAILAEPPASGFSVLLYAIPPLVFIASGTLLILLVRRFTHPASSVRPAVCGIPEPGSMSSSLITAGTGDRYDGRLDDDLSRLD